MSLSFPGQFLIKGYFYYGKKKKLNEASFFKIMYLFIYLVS